MYLSSDVAPPTYRLHATAVTSLLPAAASRRSLCHSFRSRSSLVLHLPSVFVFLLPFMLIQASPPMVSPSISHLLYATTTCNTHARAYTQLSRSLAY